FFAFAAGFIDSVVGGGGLIQIPALLINLPNYSLTTLFGTNKIAALSGTSVAAVQDAQKIKYKFKLLFIISFFSFISSNLGARSLSHIYVNTLKPVILVILILIALYTFLKKELGSVQTKSLSFSKQAIYGSLMGIVVGFYDGFFGPGTGSFFVLGFVILLGFEFVTASAYAKMINCVTNISALIVFIRQGHFLLDLAIMMAVCNIIGSIVGSRLALRKGNGFIRIVFLVIVTLMILRYGYDVLIKS
ncbi:MAG: TSUP family transporter, partial [Bacteroidota bacterium]|nr:TSUP family transporter [Bacteroidota bacterium]